MHDSIISFLRESLSPPVNTSSCLCSIFFLFWLSLTHFDLYAALTLQSFWESFLWSIFWNEWLANEAFLAALFGLYSKLITSGPTRGVTIHQLHRCIDLYSYDPTTSICARQVGLPDDIYRSNIVLKGNQSIVSILGNNALDLSTSDFIWMFFLALSLLMIKALNVTRFSLPICDVIATRQQQRKDNKT